MSATAPPAVYGGDEISALVIDPGSTWSRIGFAGDDTPKVVMPSSYGKDGSQMYIGDNELHSVRAGMEIANAMTDGHVGDWDETIKLWDYAFTKRLYSDPKEHPVLLTEPSWTPPKVRERAAEVLFEQFETPACYLAKNSVCSAFACGKPTALVVDIGSAVASVTPVVDGLVLRKAAVRSPYAGDFLNAHALADFKKKGIELVPHFLVARKTAVELGQPAQATLKDIPGITDSFRKFELDRVLLEFKESTVQVMEQPYNDAIAGARQQRPFEFPDGYNIGFGAERYQIGEALFQPSLFALPDTPADPAAQGVAQLVAAAVAACDVDARANLVNNILVIGGTTLVQGFTERLNYELTQLFPGMKIRIQSPGNGSERRFSSWIGGSILASLGTFHQMWIGKKEYDEVGPSIVDKRCK
ncbi:actin family [Dipodascopsis tothii]|uniref:actin family n=1 Tax=Dipodascopsis tothii TaxID=44089 RepID=UPI0034CFEAD4